MSSTAAEGDPPEAGAATRPGGGSSRRPPGQGAGRPAAAHRRTARSLASHQREQPGTASRQREQPGRARLKRAMAAGRARAHAAAREARMVAHATLAEAWADRVLGLAAEAAFWALLSLTPLTLVLVAAIGYLTPLFGSHITVLVELKIQRAAGHFLAPTAVHNVVVPVLQDVARNGRGGIISVGSLLALWTGSTAINTYVNTITIAYGMRDMRSAVRARLLAFVIYLGTLVVGIVALPLLVTAPGWIVDLAPGAVTRIVRPAVAFGYWPVVVAVSTALLAVFYHVVVPVRGSWLRDLPGALTAMLLWLASSFLLRTYLSYAIRHSPTYGALSAPIAALLFLYFTSLAVLLGAELNAQIDSERTGRNPRAVAGDAGRAGPAPGGP